MAQVVERWHSGLSPGTDIHFQFRIAFNLFSLGVRLFITMSIRMVPASFLFHV